MAFNRNFKTLEEVLNTHQLTYSQETLEITARREPSHILSEDLAFTISKVPYSVSEPAICENIIYPILKDAWKLYSDKLILWSHRSIFYDETLCGVPDYIIARRSPRGKIFFELPVAAVVEAKRDDFIGGWAQCSLEMLTIQKLNPTPETEIYGIVSNGNAWEIGRLSGNDFVQFSNSFSLGDLPRLYNALCTILEHCAEQLELATA